MGRHACAVVAHPATGILWMQRQQTPQVLALSVVAFPPIVPGKMPPHSTWRFSCCASSRSYSDLIRSPTERAGSPIPSESTTSHHLSATLFSSVVLLAESEYPCDDAHRRSFLPNSLSTHADERDGATGELVVFSPSLRLFLHTCAEPYSVTSKDWATF